MKNIATWTMANQMFLFLQWTSSICLLDAKILNLILSTVQVHIAALYSWVDYASTTTQKVPTALLLVFKATPRSRLSQTMNLQQANNRQQVGCSVLNYHHLHHLHHRLLPQDLSRRNRTSQSSPGVHRVAWGRRPLLGISHAASLLRKSHTHHC